MNRIRGLIGAPEDFFGDPMSGARGARPAVVEGAQLGADVVERARDGVPKLGLIGLHVLGAIGPHVAEVVKSLVVGGVVLA